MPMTVDDIYLITPKLSLARPGDVDALTPWLGADLPGGYDRFVTGLGQGTYCGRLMVWMPAQILADCESERAFIREYFDDFWGDDGTIAMEEAARCVPFASTVDGDKVLYSLDRRQVFVLPRHGQEVIWMPQGHDDPRDWGLRNGEDKQAESEWRYFDSHVERGIIELFSSGSFLIQEMAQRIAERFPPAHRIDAPWGARLFLPDIHGMAQLTQAPGDKRVGVRLEFDLAAAAQVQVLVDELANQGFRETWRWPSLKGPG